MGKVIVKYNAKIHTKYFESNPIFSIEIFNSITAQWFNFLDGIRFMGEVLRKQKTISDEDASNNENIRFLLDQIERNIYPKTRIRLISGKFQVESREKNVKIVANNYDVKQTSKTVTFDFGENWSLQEKDFTSFKQTILVASQHNIYRLYDKIIQSENTNSNLQKENEKVLLEIIDIKSQLNTTRSDLEDKRKQLITAEDRVKTLEGDNKNLEDSVIKGKEKATEYQKTIDSLNASYEGLEKDLINSTKRYDQLQNEFKDYKETKESEHPNKIAAKNVYTNFVRDVSSADAELQDTNYKLSNISLDIKATVENDGNGVILGLVDFDSLQTINGGGISSIRMEIERDTNPQEISFTVPDVKEMTYSKVKSILIDAGYRLEPIYQNPNSENAKGLSVKQFPAAGSELAQGETVSVLFQ